MKKIFLLMSLTFAAFFAGGCGGPSGEPAKAAVPPASVRHVSMEEAAEMMAAEKGHILLDVRTPEEYASGHIPGAISLPNERIETTAPSELPDKKQRIFLYCRSGRRSQAAAEKLAKMGYTDLVECGGVMDWKGELVKGN